MISCGGKRKSTAGKFCHYAEMNRRLAIVLILLIAAPLSLWYALLQGSLNISAAELWQSLSGARDSTVYRVIHE
jgi:ABC-type enterobactin transport system permease subunit